jgi:hypothetical protein
VERGPTGATLARRPDANGAPHPDARAYATTFSGRYAHRVIEGGIGHNLPQEALQACADAIVEVDTYIGPVGVRSVLAAARCCPS